MAANKGYLKSLEIIPNEKYYKKHPETRFNKQLENLKWCSENNDSIPMLTILTGRNGIGKSMLLQLIHWRWNNGKRLKIAKFKMNDKIKIKNTELVFIDFYGRIFDLKKRNIYEDEIYKDAKHPQINFSIDTNTEYKNKYNNSSNTSKTFSSIEELIKNNKSKLDKLNEFINKNSQYFKYRIEIEKIIQSKEKKMENGEIKKIIINEYDNIIFLTQENTEVEMIYLSSGEKIILLTLLWRFEAETANSKNKKITNTKNKKRSNNKNKKISNTKNKKISNTKNKKISNSKNKKRSNSKNKKRILLLDEPDALIHPGVCIEIVKAIKEALVEKLKIQVIMTTHSPTTIALFHRAEIPSDCFFLMNQNENNKIQIRRCKNKSEAFHELHSNLISVDLPFRVIFVEGKSDKDYYEKIIEQLFDQKIVEKIIEVIFKAAQDDSDEKKCGSKASVLKIIECTKGVKLEEFISGIIDCDYEPEKKKFKNLSYTIRNSLENYIMDPTNICSFLLNYKKEGSFRTELKDVLEEREKENGLAFIDEFLKSLNENRKIGSITKLNMKNCENIPLQAIIDIMKEKINDYLFETIGGCPRIFKKNFSNYYHKLKMGKTDIDNDESTFDRAESLKSLINEEKVSRCWYGPDDIRELSYPRFMLEMRGHDLESLYTNVIFKIEKPISEKSKYSSKLGKEIIEQLDKHFFIPYDLIEIIKKLSDS